MLDARQLRDLLRGQPAVRAEDVEDLLAHQLLENVLQLAALIWGAGALKGSVDNLRETMREMAGTVKEVQTTTTTLSVDVAVLKAQSLKK